jgi:DNA-directed RNA polymerase
VDLEDEKEYHRAAIYLTKLAMSSVEDLFSQAHEIKSWLIECAAITSKYNIPISWVTPLGYPVYQPYYKSPKFEQIDTLILSTHVNVDQEKINLNISKQKSAFPPNFVHR